MARLFSERDLQPPEQFVQFHPDTVLRNWGAGCLFRISDAATGAICFGATGSGKTSGPGKELALAYLAEGFGFVVLCAKPEEAGQWEQWAKLTDRKSDLRIVDAAGTYRFNFLNSTSDEGGGYTINTTATLCELAAGIVSGGEDGGGSGESKFFTDNLRLHISNHVDLCTLSGLGVSMPVMREILVSAPKTVTEAKTDAWLNGNGTCALLLRTAAERMKDADEETRADFEECRNYWLNDWADLSDRSRSIVQIMFTQLVRPFVMRPLRRLFSSDTNLSPEDALKGRIIVVNLSTQEYGVVGQAANLVWKYCTQTQIMRRSQPKHGYLRPVCIYADEYQGLYTPFDAVYQSVARSAGGCTIALTQTREALRRVAKDADSVDALLANLQAKFFCQNTGETNSWASQHVFGDAWVEVENTTITQQRQQETGMDSGSAGISTSKQLRRIVDPSRFTTLSKGGAVNAFQVETILYNGGAQYEVIEEGRAVQRPYRLLQLNQKKEL